MILHILSQELQNQNKIAVFIFENNHNWSIFIFKENALIEAVKEKQNLTNEENISFSPHKEIKVDGIFRVF